ncbi:probable leucine-rich repeat receptor-like protein kinase At1g68400 [Phoenix dactylifera]|uniref:Probable leucine-rich repeat receptor-like protein kinase At1g68400 n=1 Tax=Phoenix dactylifera TaxID=42345 RepID=A0A8B7CE61_PHODC|nr:probable leucine-rich repeat receptor-like protein kinase At1g68400 [Phoenix dactylifera]
MKRPQVSCRLTRRLCDMRLGMSISVFVIVFAQIFAIAASKLAIEELYHNERNDLIQLRDSLSSTVNLHSNWTGPPCHNDQSRWLGIACSDSHVVGIDLEGIQLTGSLLTTAFQNMAYLTTLSLSNNALHGYLPSLKGLDNLQVVSFSRNRFSGSIPSDFVALPNLSRLELQDNLLNGSIPPFDQRTLTAFNVSYNFIEGQVPGTSALQRFPSSSFDHNLELCGTPMAKSCAVALPGAGVPPSKPEGSAPPHSTSHLSQSRAKGLGPRGVALIAVGASMVSFMAIFSVLCYYKRYYKKAEGKGDHSGAASIEFVEKASKGSESTTEPERAGQLEFFNKERQLFSLDDLLRSSAEVLGKGKLGTTYRVTLEPGVVVVVKRPKNINGVSKKEFVQQMQLLGSLRHENLVEIISFYYSKNEKLIVYEHVPGESLFQLLHDNRGEGRVPLNWAARLNIVKGIARGLAYLHQCLPSLKVPHGNLKSSNVLILHNKHRPEYQPKLTDFGFQALLLSPNQSHKLAIGKSPEFTQGRKLTNKTDVYCFGLMLLEAITGQVPGDDEVDLPEWVSLVIRNDWSTDILDLEISAERESHGDMLRLTEIALECAALEPERRPKMSEVVKRIEEIKEPNSEGRI